jgi:hypothetical protein
MPQRASVFCNFYIRVDREALVSERALDVGSVAFKAMSTKMPLMTRKLSFISEVKFVFLRNFYFVNHLNNTKSQQMLLTS